MGRIRDAFHLLNTREKSAGLRSLRLRLFAFIAFFAAAVLLAATMLLVALGVFNNGANRCRTWLNDQVEAARLAITADFGGASIRGAYLSDVLGTIVDSYLDAMGQESLSALDGDPDAVYQLLDRQINELLGSLNGTGCSGVFVILETSSSGNYDDGSRAGIFIKRTEPNAVDLIGSKVHYLRGPAGIARSRGIGLLGQWQMEFSVEPGDYYNLSLSAAGEHPGLSLNRIYRWSERTLLKQNSESGMLLCVPILGAGGEVYGVCGLEISSMLFKLSYSPDDELFPRAFVALTPRDASTLHMDAGLIAGNSYLTNPVTGSFTVRGAGELFTTYFSQDGETYGGVSQDVKLYPDGAAFAGDQWQVTILVPEQDINAAMRGGNLRVLLALLGLFGVSLAGAALVSRRSLHPLLDDLASIKSGEGKSRYLEINDLIEYLTERDRQQDAIAQQPSPPKASPSGGEAEDSVPNMEGYHRFIRAIETLSPAERAVFNLYMEGYTAQEITKILYLSINTIKTHNKRIFMKLGVESRRELMVYVSMMTREPQDE